MKKLLSLLLALALLLSLGSPALAAGAPVLVLSNAEAEPGAEVTLTLSIQNSSGLKGISAELSYDTKVLTLVSATPLISDGTWMIDTIADDHLVYWYSPTTYSGEAIVSVTFRVAVTAPACSSQVTLAFGDWDGIYDSTGAEITEFSVTPGVVTVADSGTNPESPLDHVTLALSDTSVEPGEEAVLTLTIQNSSGLKGISAELVYDADVLTLVSATPLISDGTWMIDSIAQDHLLYWYSPTTYSGSQIASITFRAAKSAPVGTTQVSLRFGDWDGIYDSTGAEITNYSVTPGTVTVIASLPSYTISFDANGGVNAPNDQAVTQGEALTLPSAFPTREGWLFLGWAMSSSAENAQLQPGVAFVPTGNTTLYAVWLDLYAPDFKLPASLQSIGDEAFAGTAVRYAAFPESLSELGSRVFAGCTRLVAVYAPALVTNILADAFNGAPDSLVLLGQITSAIAEFAAQYGFRFEAVKIS